jgi:hypothetical protein
MATLIYNSNGSLMDIQQGGPDKAIIGNQEVPFITGSQLRQYAATVYSEASFMGLTRQISPADPIGEMRRETFAITYTMYNYAMAKGAAFRNAGRRYGLAELLVDSNYTKGISSPAHHEYFGTGGDDTRRQMSTLAVIKLFTKQTHDVQDVMSKLQGVQYWDGSDLFRLYQSHFRAKNGYELSNPAHGAIYQGVNVVSGAQVISSCTAQNPTVASKRQYTYMSAMTAGGTIFFKIHPQAAAQGITW